MFFQFFFWSNTRQHEKLKRIVQRALEFVKAGYKIKLDLANILKKKKLYFFFKFKHFVFGKYKLLRLTI